MRSPELSPGYLSEQLQKHFKGIADDLGIEYGQRTVSVDGYRYPNVPDIDPRKLRTHSTGFSPYDGTKMLNLVGLDETLQPASHFFVGEDPTIDGDSTRLNLIHAVPLENGQSPVHLTASSASTRRGEGLLTRPALSVVPMFQHSDYNMHDESSFRMGESPLNANRISHYDIGQKFKEVIESSAKIPSNIGMIDSNQRGLSRVREFQSQHRLSPTEIPLRLWKRDATSREVGMVGLGAYDTDTEQYRHLLTGNDR